MAVSSPDLKEFLLATPFFGGLSDASLDLLVSMLVERRFDDGATVVTEGEAGRSMFVVHSGQLVVSKLAASGRAIRMAGLGPGDFFGEMGLLTGEPRTATVLAEEETEVLEINNLCLKPILEENPELVAGLSRIVEERRSGLDRMENEAKGGEKTDKTNVFNSIKRFFGLKD